MSHSFVPPQVERPKDSQGRWARVVDYYATNVFDVRAMRKRLSTHDISLLTKVMKSGGTIDAALAERVAAAACEWAIEKGATHYCHWFQPQTGSTAEKHDGFLWLDKNDLPIERFTGSELLQGEPDASSFPSGGIRSTFEARGYTSWDPSSPMFILEGETGKSLYIPSIFISYHGEALDFKTPLLRSNAALSRVATETLHYLGETSVEYVTTFAGVEQEFFIIDKSVAQKRPDLRFAGRAVMGRGSPKGQELEDHYFGNIPTRIQTFINDVEIELYKLGIPIKTRHNEVAPGQFEVAPIYESANVAADHNQLLMTILKSIGLKHGFFVCLHEKPFEGVNGSGKHVNWSLGDSVGRNLLDPGTSPHQNIIFLAFLSGILLGIYKHADVLRASIASAGNDHRLGANEAPPAVVSVFLGNTLDRVLNTLESGSGEFVSAEKTILDLGVGQIQKIMQDNTDRNRTSPFAFTGNKFEFRAVGSSASINYPTTILNAATVSGLTELNRRLKSKAQPNGVVSEKDILSIIKDIVVETKNIRFEGNGYGEEWLQEAARRGLSNFPDTPSALEVFKDATKTKFLVDSGVLSANDIQSRLFIQQERYLKQRLIEVNCAIDMCRKEILPVVLRHQGQILETALKAESLNVLSPAKEIAIELTFEITSFLNALTALETAREELLKNEAAQHEDPTAACVKMAQVVLPALATLVEVTNNLEGQIPGSVWPYPSYSDLLFSLG